MQGDPLEFLPIWGVFVVTLLLVLLSIEAGYRWARHKQRNFEEEKEAPVGAVVGATLGLLAFLLAITFGMAADRLALRRDVLVEEVNAIGTAYLRADLLPQSHGSEVRRILREYVDERLHWGGVEAIQASLSSQELQRRLWTEAVAVGELDAHSEIARLFIEAVGEVLNLHTKRIVVRDRNRIPGAFWIVLYVVASLAVAAMGYHGGIAGTRRSPAMLAIAIAFSSVIVLIADLDRPGEGSITVSQQAMMDLRDSISGAKP